MRIIDSHQHFWDLARGYYNWLSPDLTPLYRNFAPGDLAPILKTQSVEQTLLVQAADSVAETEFMLSLAKQHDFIGGVIGWLDMASEEAVATIRQLSENEKFKGIRPMLQDLSDEQWILKPELDPCFKILVELDLVFEALVLPKHLPHLKTLLARYPSLRVVIDHAAKPHISEGFSSEINKQWQRDIADLSILPNVFCKLSGLITEAQPGATFEHLQPFMQHLLVNFGAQKLAWGSDWPVLNLASDYASWKAIVARFVSSLTIEEQQAIWADTAKSIYDI